MRVLYPPTVSVVLGVGSRHLLPKSPKSPMPTLHHYPLLAGSRFVRLILAEYGEEAVLVEETPWERGGDLVKLNPSGELPVFVDDDGAVVAGASVIAEYLAETRGVHVG